jgi:hypothetical protein
LYGGGSGSGSVGTQGIIIFTYNASVTYASSVSETATATDAVTGGFTYPSSVSETATATDDILGGFGYSRSVAEAAAASDLPTPSSTFNGDISESATATDTITSTLQWTPIDDGQTPNWQNINTTL